MPMPELVFLKLGGSLITDKARPFTARYGKLDELVDQIAGVLAQNPGLQLVLGHGSGSFGHTPAKQYGTREGVETAQDWRGFTEVGFQASALNRLVMETLAKAGIAALALPPLGAVIAQKGAIATWDITPLESALKASLLPVIYGDVVFDSLIGGTILSTEDLFAHLAGELHPDRILLAGLEQAVWSDFPARKQRLERLTRESFKRFRPGIGAAAGTDVTGGMLSKVEQMLALVEQNPDLTVQIFSAEPPGNLRRAMLGEHIGTLITV